jgi:proline iminopeptidase
MDTLADERPVVFYDQFGSGRSGRCDEARFYDVDYFVDELRAVRLQLGLGELHLFGHSWGTIVATDYLSGRPTGVRSAIFASPCMSMRRWINTCRRHLAELPANMGALITDQARCRGTEAAYQEALALYHRTYEHRRGRMPPDSPWAVYGRKVYESLWGPNEYTVTGSLREFEHADRLRTMTLAALFLCGRYDSASPEDAAYYRSLLPGAELHVFEESAHFPHVEEEAAFFRVVRAFLNRHD